MFGGMSEKSLRILYSNGLGIIIVLFVGLAIATFYPAPELAPFAADLPAVAREAARDVHKAAMQDYNRDVTVVALISALIVLGASIWSEAKKPLFAGGFLIGGMLTLVYGMQRGLTSGVPAVAFFSVAVGLAVVIYLGHQRFFSARAVAARAKVREEDLRSAYARMPQFAPPQQPMPQQFTQPPPFQQGHSQNQYPPQRQYPPQPEQQYPVYPPIQDGRGPYGH